MPQEPQQDGADLTGVMIAQGGKPSLFVCTVCDRRMFERDGCHCCPTCTNSVIVDKP